jgi:hypothetical protein
MENDNKILPHKAIDVSELASKLQADLAAIRAILTLFTDYHEEPHNEVIHGVITLTSKLMQDMAVLYDVDKAPPHPKEAWGTAQISALEAFGLIEKLPTDELRKRALSGFRGVVCALGVQS